MNLHSLSSIDYYIQPPSIETMRLPHRAIWPIAQKVYSASLMGWESSVWMCPLSLLATVWQNTMQVVENGFAPSSDVWGPFGPLFVVKSGLHSITANGINSYFVASSPPLFIPFTKLLLTWSGNSLTQPATTSIPQPPSASGRHLSTFCPPVSHHDAYQFTLIELIGGLCVQGVGKITYKCAQISPEGAPRRVIRFCCVPILKKTNSCNARSIRALAAALPTQHPDRFEPMRRNDEKMPFRSTA